MISPLGGKPRFSSQDHITSKRLLSIRPVLTGADLDLEILLVVNSIETFGQHKGYGVSSKRCAYYKS